MMQTIKQFYGIKLQATDGGIGHVKDFYFDDRHWAIRYLVVDTGSWLSGRKVLIAPHAFGSLEMMGKLLSVNLTRKQIEDSPAIESHQPVSRQYEEDYYQYYGWPHYWQGDGLWGNGGYPAMDLVPAEPMPMEPATVRGSLQTNDADAHLRSTLSVRGYNLQASDGVIGHVADFIMDARNWAIRKLVIKTGHRFSGHEVEIPTNKVKSISYEESTVHVSLTSKEVEQSPAHELIVDRLAA